MIVTYLDNKIQPIDIIMTNSDIIGRYHYTIMSHPDINKAYHSKVMPYRDLKPQCHEIKETQSSCLTSS